MCASGRPTKKNIRQVVSQQPLVCEHARTFVNRQVAKRPSHYVGGSAAYARQLDVILVSSKALCVSDTAIAKDV